MKSSIATYIRANAVRSLPARWITYRSSPGCLICSARVLCYRFCSSRPHPIRRAPGGTAICVHSKTIRCWTNASSAKCHGFCTVQTLHRTSILVSRLAWCDRSVQTDPTAQMRFFKRPRRLHLPLALPVAIVILKEMVKSNSAISCFVFKW